MGRQGNKFGWHSGVLTCKDAKVRGDLYVQDDIVFSDVSAGVLGVTGGIDMTGTTSAVGIDMSGGTFATADIRLGNAATVDNSTNGTVLCTEPVWNFRATTGFIHSYDTSNYLTSTVASNGVCKLATTGSADSFEIETGDGKIILDAKTDIDLDPEGNDINLLGDGAGKITMAATSVTLYGGDTSADSLVLRGSSAAATESITVLDGTSVTVLGTSVILDGSTTVDGDHTFGTGTGAVSLNGDTTVAAGKTLYIRDASQSIASASDDLMTLTSPTLTLASVTKINLDGPVDVSGELAVEDDHVLRLGTTDGAATRVLLQWEETTSGIGFLQMGTLSTPMVLNTNPGATVVPFSVNTTHSAGAGDCDDFVGVYSKLTVSGDGDSGLTGVPIASRLYIDGALSQGYAVQTKMQIDSTDGFVAAAGHSVSLTINNAFTASQTLNVAEFLMASDEARIVTCTSENFNMVLIKNNANVAGLNSLLKLVSAGSDDPASIMHIEGATDNGFIQFDTGSDCSADASGVAGNRTHMIKCRFDSTTFYINGYAA